eukprot:15432666-Alexandrium_andersonii.AAC.1
MVTSAKPHQQSVPGAQSAVPLEASPHHCRPRTSGRQGPQPSRPPPLRGSTTSPSPRLGHRGP